VSGPASGDCVFAFQTALGWMAALGRGRTLKALAFGHSSAAEAMAALGGPALAGACRRNWNAALVKRLQAYAAGKCEDFRQVEVDPGVVSRFQRRVIETCRKIPWGSTWTYGELAAKAGYPGAARAAGNCMAANRIPLVVPCHRVVGADGRLRGYSGPGGLRMKQRLLELERQRG